MCWRPARPSPSPRWIPDSHSRFRTICRISISPPSRSLGERRGATSFAQGCNASLHTTLPFASVARVNLLEEKPEAISGASSGDIPVSFHPFEIITLRLSAISH
ncbi:MAG: glycosyl hydrolase-related protein [Terrimicrobiaceae bacterium]